MSLTDRVALVTGAGRGIGAAVAERLSAEGLRVALVARNEEQLRAVAANCVGTTIVIPTDVTATDAADLVYERVEREWGPVEVLVANAGAGHAARLERTTDADWARMLELNLTAPFRFLRRAVAAMRSMAWGRIAVLASTAAQVGDPYIAAYTASKHGVLGLVRSAAAELARDGITVNAICPGYVDTPMTEQTIANIVTASGRSADEARAALERKQSIGRLVTPAEVAAAVWFALQNGAVTGAAINVDGGAVR